MFIDAQLERANCTGATMYQCVFHRAKCREAVFRDANLVYVDFSRADITRADFTGAEVFRANLHSVQDSGARISGRAVALGTDPELAAAQNWRPQLPLPKE